MYTVARSVKGPSHCIHDVRRAARRSLWLASSVKVLPHCMHDVRHVAVYMTDAHNNIITTSGPVYNKVPGAVDVPSWSKHPTQPSPVLVNH